MSSNSGFPLRFFIPSLSASFRRAAPGLCLVVFMPVLWLGAQPGPGPTPAPVPPTAPPAAPPPGPETPFPGAPPEAPSPGDPAVAQQGYRNALALYQKGQYNESLGIIRNVFSAAPTSYELRMLAAANYMRLGSYPSAATHLRTCIAQHPARPEPVAMLGSVYRAMNQPGAAIPILTNGIVRHNGDVRLRMELAQVYYSMGQFFPARAQLERILQTDANYFDALYLDGMIFLREGKFENAEFRLNQALQQKPRNKNVLASLYNNLGMALERSGDAVKDTQKDRAAYYYQSAENNYGFALSVDPNHPAAAANRDRVRGKRESP